MSTEPTIAQKAYGDIAPALADLSDRVLFGEVWERAGLSKRAGTVMSALRNDGQGWRVLAIPSALMGCASISTDFHLPAMPAMAHAVGADAGAMEWTISGDLIPCAGASAAPASTRLAPASS